LRRVREGALGIFALRRARRRARNSCVLKGYPRPVSWLEPLWRRAARHQIRKAEQSFVEISYLRPQCGVRDRSRQPDSDGDEARKVPKQRTG
jgi:hypothetical protein